jgi:hypothetical protein
VSHPWQPYLDNLQRKGMRADMARLTLARKIAALALAIWKKGETFDPKKLNWTTLPFRVDCRRNESGN